LGGLVSTSQQNDQKRPSRYVLNPRGWAEGNPHLTHIVAEALVVAGIASRQPVNPDQNARTAGTISKAAKPSIEGAGPDDCDHQPTLTGPPAIANHSSQ